MVWLIDFEDPTNNQFVVTNQYTIQESKDRISSVSTKRPDVLLFINGIPLVVLELKNAANENATIKSAFKQIETYKSTIPSLFTYNAFSVISDGLEAKAGTVSSGIGRFMAWKSADGKEEASNLVSQLETLINGMLNKETLIDLIRYFIVFEKSKKEDPKSGQITINTVKKLVDHEVSLSHYFHRNFLTHCLHYYSQTGFSMCFYRMRKRSGIYSFLRMVNSTRLFSIRDSGLLLLAMGLEPP